MARKSAIDPHKHETPQERASRHDQVARTVRAKFDTRATAFNYKAWDAMHREAEYATIFDPLGGMSLAFLAKPGGR